MPKATERPETDNPAELMYTTEFEGLSQYRPPLCFELAGRTLDMVFDDGNEYYVDFLDGQTLSYRINRVDCLMERYECLKADDSVYLVHCEKKGRKPREAMTFVIDLESGLVTGDFATQGAVPSKPRLVQRKTVFGAIRRPGMELPAERHSFSEELVGKKIEWVYSPKFKIIHIYQTKDVIRVGFSKDMPMPEPDPDRFPNGPFEEPAIHVKINDRIHIFSWVEENSNGTRGFLVMNVQRLIDVGCFFGVNPWGEPESYMVAAYGKWVTEELPEEKRPLKPTK
jgi:Molybdenum cofactor biosynthesis protein F.